jgi:hypothetical protein
VRAKRALALLLSMLAAGCSQLAPFVTLSEGAPGVNDPRRRVAICYNALMSTATPEKLAAAAQAECGADATAERIDTDYQMMVCPVLLPARATFACTVKQ